MHHHSLAIFIFLILIEKLALKAIQKKSERKNSYKRKILFLVRVLPGVGVAMFMAGVPIGVFPGVRTGVLPPI